MPTDPARATADGRRTRGQQTRKRLLDATIRVIGRDGPAGVTHRSVAAEAGLTKSLATYHFATIDELLEAALAESTEQYVREVSARLPEGCTVEELVAILAASFEERRADWLAAYELFLYAARRPALRPAARLWTDWTASLARRYTSDPLAVEAFVSAIDGIGLHALLSDDPVDAPRVARLLTRLLAPSR